MRKLSAIPRDSRFINVAKGRMLGHESTCGESAIVGKTDRWWWEHRSLGALNSVYLLDRRPPLRRQCGDENSRREEFRKINRGQNCSELWFNCTHAQVPCQPILR